MICVSIIFTIMITRRPTSRSPRNLKHHSVIFSSIPWPVQQSIPARSSTTTCRGTRQLSSNHTSSAVVLQNQSLLVSSRTWKCQLWHKHPFDSLMCFCSILWFYSTLEGDSEFRACSGRWTVLILVSLPWPLIGSWTKWLHPTAVDIKHGWNLHVTLETRMLRIFARFLTISQHVIVQWVLYIGLYLRKTMQNACVSRSSCDSATATWLDRRLPVLLQLHHPGRGIDAEQWRSSKVKVW